MTRYRLRTDPALYFFGLGALACLVVSVPATAAAMELFHGFAWGIVATVVFEIGAVGSELSTLAIPQWRKRLMCLTIALLLATTGANYALGVDAFLKATLPTSYAEVRAAGLGWLLAVVASALFPALLFVFLTAFTARYRMLRGGYDTPMAVVAFWLGSAWKIQRAEYDAQLAQVRQELSQFGESAGAELAHLRNQLAGWSERASRAEERLAQQPALITEEIVTVARRELSMRQLAKVLELPESTVRRKVARIEEVEAQR